MQPQAHLDFYSLPSLAASVVSSRAFFKNGTSVVPPVPVKFSSPLDCDEELAKFCRVPFHGFLDGKMMYLVTIEICFCLKALRDVVTAV